MSTDIERIRKLVTEDLLVAAVELPTNHRTKTFIADDLEGVLAQFDDDANYAHFVIRVKRTTSPLPLPSSEPGTPLLSIDSMVNETLELSERINEQRSSSEPIDEIPPKEPPQREPSPEYDPQFLLENAKILEENNDLPLARNIYNALVRKGLLIPQGLAGLASTFEKEGDHERSIRCYQEAIAYSSELPFYQGLAAVQIRIGNDEEAAQTLLHALGIVSLTDEQMFELHKSLGNCYTRLGDYAKAEHQYRKAYDLNSKSDVLQVNVGSLALQKSDYESAQKHFQKALELNSSNDKAISGLGMVHLGKNSLQKAHDCFVASLKLNINNLGAIYNLVKCAYELKKFDETSQILQKFILSNPVNTNILYSYAGILFHQGEYRASTNEAKKILETNPNHAGAKELVELIQAKFDGTEPTNSQPPA